MRRERKRISGYTDFGGIRIPPLPQFIVMEDRSSGLMWTLSLSGSFPSLIVALDGNTPERERNLYGVYEGPYVAPNVRLYVDGGVLAAEYAQGPIGNQRVLARRGNERNFVEITWDGTDTDDVPNLAYTTISV